MANACLTRFSQCHICIFPGNIKEPCDFGMFSGDMKIQHWEQKR